MMETTGKNIRRWEQSELLCRTGSWEYDVVSGRIWGSKNAFAIYGIKLDLNENPEQFLPLERVESCIFDRDRIHAALINLIESNIAYEQEYSII